MSKPKQPSIEYRNYLLPASFPLIILGGEKWRISDIPSPTLHFHNCLEIGICRSDSGMMRFRNTEQAFHKGDVTILASNIPHTTYSDPGTASLWNYIFVNVEELFFPYFPVEVIGNHDVLSRMIREFYAILSRDKYPDIYWLVSSIIDEMQEQKTNYQFSVRGLMLSLIVRLLNIYIQQEGGAEVSYSENSLAIAPALHYIRTNYMIDFPMDKLAEVCELSPTHFRRLFSAVMGFGPLEYLNRIRIIKSIEFIQGEGLSIADAAARVGILDTNYFSRLFKKIIGHSPRYFRKIT